MNPLPVYCIIAACVVVFLNTLQNGFHLDDFYRIVDNPGVEEFWSPWRHFVDPSTSCTLPRIVQYRPLMPLSLSINHLYWGHSLAAYHAGNLIFHTLASIFVYGSAREILDRREGPATVVGLWFAVHPVSGITVNYLCSRDLGLMQMFLFASFWIYLVMRRRGFSVGLWIACLLCFCLALLSKTGAAMMPVVIFLFELTIGKARLRSAQALLRPLPFLVCVLTLFGFTRFYLHFSDYHTVVDSEGGLSYGAAQLQHHVFHYLSNFAWPYPIRQDPAILVVGWKQVVGAGCLLASWTAALLLWRRVPLFAFCVLAYQAMMAPTSSVIPLWADAAAYRPYAGSAFLFIGIAALLFSRPRLGAVLSLLILGHFGWASIQLNRIWKDGETLWRHSVVEGGGSLAHFNLAMSVSDVGEQRSMLEQALVINPYYILASLRLGQLEIEAGEQATGIARVRAAAAREPLVAQYQYLLAVAEHTASNPQAAVVAALEAARLQPDNVRYRYHAGWFLHLADRNADSLAHLQFVLSTRPEHEDTQYLAGYALQVAGDAAAAIKLYEAFVVRRADHDRAWFNLGFARMKTGQWPGAIKAFESCLASNPTNRNAHLHLVSCYGKVGNVQDAMRHKQLYDASK